ncbi:DUF2195 family protein [Escherichia coli]|nr:DUF2195 family protein [Escherichia coli]
MQKKTLALLLILVCTKVVQAADIPDVEINNLLSDCMYIRPVQQTNMDNLIILKTDITLKKSSGECGCLSAWLGYTGLLAQDIQDYGAGKAHFLQQGNFSLTKTPKNQSFNFVLSTDSRYVRDRKLALRVNCTPPL